jgi:predicted N-formylglutamate amidohydrolase
MSARVVISCEHASAAVPARYRSVFGGADAVIRSHRGSDLGARLLARQLALELNSRLVEARATRLLADPNRDGLEKIALTPRIGSELAGEHDGDSGSSRLLQ